MRIVKAMDAMMLRFNMGFLPSLNCVFAIPTDQQQHDAQVVTGDQLCLEIKSESTDLVKAVVGFVDYPHCCDCSTNI